LVKVPAISNMSRVRALSCRSMSEEPWNKVEVEVVVGEANPLGGEDAKI
jgi:hypothetical protein